MRGKPQETSKPVAILTVYGIGKMRPEKREQIANWLMDKAKEILLDGDSYTDGQFRARVYGRRP